jgi:hypothetical protein
MGVPPSIIHGIFLNEFSTFIDGFFIQTNHPNVWGAPMGPMTSGIGLGALDETALASSFS